jgi:hypothetical protein
LVVHTRAECIAHPLEYLSVADGALQVPFGRLRKSLCFVLGSPKQQPSVATDELASETNIMSQPNEWIKGVVRKTGVLASGKNSKFFHVVLVAGRVRADVVANKPEAVADVKLYSPVPPNELT